MDNIDDDNPESTMLGGDNSPAESDFVNITRRQQVEQCCSHFADSLKKSPVTHYARNLFTKKNALKKLPIIQWLPNYRLKHFIGDLVAGLTVGVTIIPQSLANAVIADLPPQYGLYSAFMGAFMYCIFGTAKDIALGPVAILSLLAAEFGTSRAPLYQGASYTVLLTFISGLIQLAMGLLNMGFVVQFISVPVLSGFTSAAAIVIGFSQVKKLLGLKRIPKEFLPQVEQVFVRLKETNLWDMTMGLLCIVALLSMKKINEILSARMKTEKHKVKRIVFKALWFICTARSAVVVLICSAVTAIIISSNHGHQLTLTEQISSGIIPPQLPLFSINVTVDNITITRTTQEIFSDIGEGFFLVAIVGIIESIAIAKAFARKNEYKIDASQELIAVGIANVMGSFFHSYPVTGSFNRSAINAQSGVQTPAAGLWTGLIVLLALFVMAPYFAYIPQASLAAVIICAVLPMIEYELIPHLWEVKKLDLVPFFLTFIISILVSIEYGILTGVVLSLLILLFPMARPKLRIKYEKASQHLEENPAATDDQALTDVVVIEPDQGLHFPGIEYVKDKIIKHGPFETPARPVILDAHHFSGCDYTTVQGIEELCEYFHKRNLQFIICGCPPSIKSRLEKRRIRSISFAADRPEAFRLIHANPISEQLGEERTEVISAGDGDKMYSHPLDIADDCLNANDTKK